MPKNFDLNFKIFKQNYFDPRRHHQSIIVNSCGNYIVCLRKSSKLPPVSLSPIFINFEGLKVVYTGITKASLRARNYKHFTGNNAQVSTLRKSLGALLGFEQIPRDKSSNNNRTKFGREDEQKLSEWMCNNLVMFFLPTADFNNIEIELINHFNPPLNLKSNKNVINLDFRLLLSSLRTRKE